ncbi:unnamed protein product (mitochondrion) [Plasmodiophora brassicae]|uniref:TatD related DNase n=2 Tax=Plasmodiophora brassicae TaxID=37360 RepID=A0A3P3XYX3_PLABS|nr:unnamed protein product [Plasmodiophora brassicae]
MGSAAWRSARKAVPSSLGAPLVDVGVLLGHPRLKLKHEIVDRAALAGVSHMVIVSGSLKESRQVIKLCRTLEDAGTRVLCAVGCSPNDAARHSHGRLNMSLLEAMDQYCELVGGNSDVVVAVGETGLDYDGRESAPIDQMNAMAAFLELSIQANLPAILHVKDDAHDDFCKVMDSFGPRQWRGVMHCYTDNNEAHLEKYLSYGLSIGICGWVTDERPGRGKAQQKLIREIPLDRIMIESLAPHMIPRNIRRYDFVPRIKICEPSVVSYIARKIAQCYRDAGITMSVDDIARHTTRNAMAMFNLPAAKCDQPSDDDADD